MRLKVACLAGDLTQTDQVRERAHSGEDEPTRMRRGDMPPLRPCTEELQLSPAVCSIFYNTKPAVLNTERCHRKTMFKGRRLVACTEGENQQTHDNQRTAQNQPLLYRASHPPSLWYGTQQHPILGFRPKSVTSKVRSHNDVIVLLASSRGHFARLEVVRKLVRPEVIRRLELARGERAKEKGKR